MELRYPDSIDEAARIARVALPLASRHHLPATPVNYAVLYEYVSGRNEELHKVARALFEDARGLNQEELTTLFHRFIVQDNASVLRELRGNLQSVVAAAVQSMSVLGGDSAQYQARLQHALQQLSQATTAEEVSAVIRAVVAETQSLLAGSTRLLQQLQAAHQDLEALRSEFERSQGEATLDALTQAQTRRTFDQQLVARCEESIKRGSHLSVLIVDIDRFKEFNERHGHLVGDQIIKFVADSIRDSVRGADLLARFGGEEFAVILADTPLVGAVQVGKNIVARVSRAALKQRASGERVGTITVSAGVAELDPRESPAALVRRAVTALYTAKNQGRNRVCQSGKGKRPR
jgi:diguanylate cyclase